MRMSSLRDASPAQIDAKLAELYVQEQQARAKHERIQDSIQTARIRKARNEFPCHTPYNEGDAIHAYEVLRIIIGQELPLEAEYERRPWQRYWHVTNNNGHIHRNQSCTSCFPDTQYAWRTDLSGLSEAEVVEREAYNACSVCMPIAPAEQKAARERYAREQNDARKAERQAKKDAKATKALARAEKHVEKVIAAMREMTGEINGEVFEIVHVFKRDFSVYGHDGRKGVYERTYDLPSTVGDTLYYLAETLCEGKDRSVHTPNEAVLTVLRDKEII